MSPTRMLDAELDAERDAEPLVLGERYHSEGCPDPGRLESYSARRPARPDQGEAARDVTVVRCITCGGHQVVANHSARRDA